MGRMGLIVYTRAERAYDYSYVQELCTFDVDGKEVRKVLIPRNKADYQLARYASGLRPGWTREECLTLFG